MEVSSIEELKAKASETGMYLVDHENTAELLREYNAAMTEADRLCSIADDETTPFKSKYKAREVLDKIISQLDATRTIGMLEHNTKLMKEMDTMMAETRVKLGTISWECEEPHNAQTELELACNFYFPELVAVICSASAPHEGDHFVYDPNMTPPTLPFVEVGLLGTALKCINILGILWSGRGQLYKSFLYLLSAHSLYEQYVLQKTKIPKVTADDVENSYTHNLFYLAQAYGHAGDSKKSSGYCHQTLQRQFSSGFSSPQSALEWVKNCAGIADFYLAMNQFNNCGFALSSAEKVLKDSVLTPISNASSAAEFNDVSFKAAEVEASLVHRWVKLDGSAMRKAFNNHKMRRELIILGEAIGEHVMEENSSDDFFVESPVADVTAILSSSLLQSSITTTSLPVAPAVGLESVAPFPPPPPKEFEGGKETASEAPQQPSPSCQAICHEFFVGLSVPVLPLLTVQRILVFEDARKIFLRAAARLEQGKRYYVLDGYVTDHCALCQEHSKMYHYLAEFETETKRRLAMEARRFEILKPILLVISRSSYEVLHKQISYELGEAALSMLDMKIDKLRSKSDAFDERKVKKAEISKINEFCKTALIMFAHYTWMYAPHCSSNSVSATKGIAYWQDMPLHALADAACSEPDEKQVTLEEVRPFLNAHFLCARVLQKVLNAAAEAPEGTVANRGRVFFISASLRRYEWLRKFAAKMSQKFGIEIASIPFADEFKICEEMSQLLPQKIDRMCYLGESGLTL